MKEPTSAVSEALVEAINTIISDTVRMNGGADHGSYYKQVALILAKIELYQAGGTP